MNTISKRGEGVGVDNSTPVTTRIPNDRLIELEDVAWRHRKSRAAYLRAAVLDALDREAER